MTDDRPGHRHRGLGVVPTLIAWTADTPWIDGFVSGIGKRR